MRKKSVSLHIIFCLDISVEYARVDNFCLERFLFVLIVDCRRGGASENSTAPSRFCQISLIFFLFLTFYISTDSSCGNKIWPTDALLRVLCMRACSYPLYLGMSI